MKKFFFPSALILLLMMASCYKQPAIRFGFDCSFDKNSNGISIMNAGKSAKSIILRGDITLNKGEITVELINPDDKVVFTSHLSSPQSLYIDETFQSTSGSWKLKYKSMEGAGLLRLHLNIGY